MSEAPTKSTSGVHENYDGSRRGGLCLTVIHAARLCIFMAYVRVVSGDVVLDSRDFMYLSLAAAD